jgi:hypothetical protein
MKKQFLFSVIICIGSLAQGQTWAPTGAKWTYGVAFAFLPNIEYREWICTGDTVVDSINCKVIRRYGTSMVSDLSDVMITYEDSNRVYWYQPPDSQFTMLYDFNKNAGETWLMHFDTCDLLITVDSTGMDTINGVPLKSLFIISENWAFNGKILQHIGHLWAPCPDINYHCHGILVDGGYYTGLRCYEDSLIGFHDFGIAPACNYITSVPDISERSTSFAALPNPTTGLIRLEVPEGFGEITALEIFNSAGQLQSSPEIRTETDLGVFKSGLYFIVITNGDGKRIIAKVIKDDLR